MYMTTRSLIKCKPTYNSLIVSKRIFHRELHTIASASNGHMHIHEFTLHVNQHVVKHDVIVFSEYGRWKAGALVGSSK